MHAEDDIDDSRGERRAPKLTRKRGEHARVGDDLPEARASPSVDAREDKAASGIRTIRPDRSSVKPSARPKPGMTLGCANASARAASGACMRSSPSVRSACVDLVEDAAVAEVLRLRLVPAAENVVDRDQLRASGSVPGPSDRPLRARTAGSSAWRRCACASGV